MNIRPRNIPKFQIGGGVPQWYLDRYGNRTRLLNWDLNKRYNYANQNLLVNDHRNAGNLDTVYEKNRQYTETPEAITSDIQNFYNSDGNGMSAEDFVNFYNQNAAKIRGHWTQDRTYNTKNDEVAGHNRLFRKMFLSRSNQSLDKINGFNIGYQENLDNIEGSSTWLRRMDLYENEFDENNPDLNRLHKILLKDGTFATVYKKANGDIELLKNQPQQQVIDGGNPLSNVGGEVTITGTDKSKQSQVPAAGGNKYGFDWDKIRGAAQKLFNNPDLWEAGRLIGNLRNNERVYDELLKGIKPALRLTYNTYRQVVGDEATKQGFYRRAAQGETKAALPFTSDADRQMAYLYEAKRIGDELRALGDLADNQEIRRTSDESNQHQWANTQRATEVANANIASINLANALRHNLLALKHSAQWSSIDNFLKGIEYRKRLKLAEEQALNDQIYTLTRAGEIENDKELLDLKSQFEAASKKPENQKDSFGLKVINYDAKEIKDLINRIKERLILLLIETLKNRPRYNSFSLNYKSGGKITRKRKDDLLYKSTRDVVEHFRKMSKISSDALNRRKSKIERLAPHPTKKYLQGGVAPFTVFTPISLGGETTRTQEYDNTSRSSRSSASEKSSQAHDLLKELFKSLAVEGLPSDVNGIYAALNNLMSRQRAFGNELSTEDIASMYILQMLLINNVKYFKSLFDKALTIVNTKDAESEFAIDTYGRLAVLDTETGKITYKTWDEVKKSDKYNPLRNSDLLNLRAISPSLAYDSDIITTASNATSMSEISKFLKAQLPSIGTSELTIEGYTKLDSNNIKAGLQLLKDAPAGDYKFTQYNKDLLKQALMALGYLKGILPKNMKTLLKVNSELQGTSEDSLIKLMIGSELDEDSKLEFTAVTGKAASDKDKNSEEKIQSDPLMQLIQGQGGNPRTWNLITKDSNVKMSVDGIEYSQLPKIKDDMSLNEMLSESGIGGILDSKQGITFGDLNVSPELFKDIMYSNSGGMVVTLPCKIVNGHKEVNLGVKKAYEEAIQEVESKGISKNSEEYYKLLGEVLKQKGLNSLLDSKGYPDKNKFGLFLIVEAYTTDKLKNLDTSSQYIEKVKNPDALLEERMIRALSTDSKKSNYSLDIDYWLWGDNVYRGTLFIPLTNNLNSAINAWGNLISVENARELENKFQNFNKASNVKSSNSDVL